MAEKPKEIDVFHKYSRNNKFKVVLISSLIAIVVIVLFYFAAKSMFPYYISYESNGGTRMGEAVQPDKYSFLEKTVEPNDIKKKGYFINKYCLDENLTKEYKFGQAIWSSFKLYIDWQPGYALVLNYASKAEEEMAKNMNTEMLKMLYEQYVRPGSTVSLPVVYNLDKNSLHYGEQLLWYENPECTGTPLSEKSYVLSSDIQLYGKWYETTDSEDKWQVDENGVLQKYLGRCNKVFLPDNALKIKDIPYDKFKQMSSDQLNEQDGRYYSAFQNVVGDMQEIFVNKEMVDIGDCAFRSMTSLTRVIFLGDEVTNIGVGAFDRCESLVNLIIPDKVTVLKANLFTDAFKLQSVRMPSGLVRIEDEAFKDSGIKVINIPDKVEFIGKLAFASCDNLTTISFNTPKVISTNVDNTDPDENNNNVFCGNSLFKFKIYVPEKLVAAYKASYPWNSYISNFESIAKM